MLFELQVLYEIVVFFKFIVLHMWEKSNSVGLCFSCMISYSLSASLANFATRLTASKSNTHRLLSTQCRRHSPGAVLISALNAAHDHCIDCPNDTKWASSGDSDSGGKFLSNQWNLTYTMVSVLEGAQRHRVACVRDECAAWGSEGKSKINGLNI